MKVIIKIIKQLKDSGVSIDGVTKTIKHEINQLLTIYLEYNILYVDITVSLS